MRSINLLKVPSLAAIAASAALGACGTTSISSEPASRVGGDYQVFRFAGLSARDGRPAVPGAQWTTTEFADLKELRAHCVQQVEAQAPNVLKDVGKGTLMTAVPTAILGGLGTGYGAASALGAEAATYGEYGAYSAGGSATGSGLGSSVRQREMALRNSLYYCMHIGTQGANRAGRLKGIAVAPSPYNVRSRGVPQPAATSQYRQPQQENYRPPAESAPPQEEPSQPLF